MQELVFELGAIGHFFDELARMMLAKREGIIAAHTYFVVAHYVYHKVERFGVVHLSLIHI